MRNWIALTLIFLTNLTFGQDVEMADSFRSEGKIYVLVAIVVLILVGMFIYMFRLERKIKNLEK